MAAKPGTPLPPKPPPSPLPSTHPGSTPAGHFPSASRSTVLPDPFAPGSRLEIQCMQQPHVDASLKLPALLISSSIGLRQKADRSPAAIAGGSPGSAKSGTVAWGFFDEQAVIAQGHQLQGQYQEPCKEQFQQRWWQQGQGQCPEGPYQEASQAKPLQEYLWGQPMTSQSHQSISLCGGSYKGLLDGLQDVRGKVYSPAAAGVAAQWVYPLEPRCSNASSASQGSLQHAASGEHTPQSQPSMYGQSFGQGLGTAPSAAVLPNVG